MQGEAAEAIKTEVDLMRRCTSKYVVQLLDAFEKTDKSGLRREMWLVMELCFDSVDGVMKRRDEAFAEAELVYVVAGVTQALDYLHTECKIIHRDIKAAD